MVIASPFLTARFSVPGVNVGVAGTSSTSGSATGEVTTPVGTPFPTRSLAATSVTTEFLPSDTVSPTTSEDGRTTALDLIVTPAPALLAPRCPETIVAPFFSSTPSSPRTEKSVRVC